MAILLKCHKGIGPAARGIALVALDNFSARYDLDRHEGRFSRPAHKLYRQSYVNRILVLQTAKGGVASAWMLREMAARDNISRQKPLSSTAPTPSSHRAQPSPI
jgi:uncharacterized protein